MKLHELDEMFQIIESELETMDGSDLTPELEQRLLELLATREGITADYKNKINNYCKMISNLEVLAGVRQAEAERLKKLAEADKQKVDFLKSRLKQSMELMEIKKISTDGYNISVCQNSVASMYFDQEKVPSEYQKTTIDVDTKRMREALQNGVDIPGAGFYEKGSHIRIK